MTSQGVENILTLLKLMFQHLWRQVRKLELGAPETFYLTDSDKKISVPICMYVEYVIVESQNMP